MLALWTGCAAGANADWIRDFSVESIYNSNISNSNRATDRLDDFAFGTSARLGRSTQLSDSLRLIFTIDLASQTFTKFDALDNYSAGATTSLRYRFGLGALAPFLSVEGSLRWKEFNDSLQEGVRSRVVVVAGKRLTERFELRAGYVFDHADARAAVYEQEGHGGFARATIRSHEQRATYGGIFGAAGSGDFLWQAAKA